MSAAKWENRFHKQVEVNNLLSDKLRETRKVRQEMIDALKQAYLEKATEVKDLKYSMQILEEAILKESENSEPAK